MAELVLDIVVKGADEAEDAIHDIGEAGEKAQKKLLKISSSSPFTKLATNVTLAAEAIAKTRGSINGLVRDLKTLSNQDIHDITEAKSYLHIEQKINDEIEKQAKLKAQIKTQDAKSITDKGLVNRLKHLKNITQELRKQAGIKDDDGSAAKEKARLKELETARRKEHNALKKRARLIKQAGQDVIRLKQWAAQREVKITKETLDELHRATVSGNRVRIAGVKRSIQKEVHLMNQRKAKIQSAFGKFGRLGGAASAGLAGGIAGLVGGATLGAIQALQNAISALARAFIEMGRRAAESIFQINTEMEQLHILMTTAAGSEAGGTKYFNEILEFATKAPFSINALADSFVKLRTAGLQPMDGTLQTLVDSVAAFGGSSDQLRLVSIAVQQMVGKGVISMEELRRQFGEQVPTAMRAMAKGLGMTILDMFDLISKGGLETKKGLEAMLGVLKEWHGGAAEKRMNSMQGALVKLRNTWIKFALDIGKSQGAFVGLRKAVLSIADGLEKFRNSNAGRKLIQELTTPLIELFDTIKNDPYTIQRWLAGGVDAFKALAEAAKIAYGWIQKTATAINYVRNTSPAGMYKDAVIGIAKEAIVPSFFIDKLFGIDLKAKMAEFGSDFLKNIQFWKQEAESLTMSTSKIKDLGGDIEFNVPHEKVKSSLQQVEDALREDSANWEQYANDAAQNISHIQEKIDELVADWKEKQASMLDEEFDLGLNLLGKEEQQEALKKRAKEFEELARKAGEAGGEGWKKQVEYLEKARDIYKELSTDVQTVSKKEVEAARKKLEYLDRITRGGKVAGMGDEYRKAKDEYERLRKLQKEGKSDIEKEKDLIREKLDILKRNREQIEAIYKTQQEMLSTQQVEEQKKQQMYEAAHEQRERWIKSEGELTSKYNAQWMQDLDKVNQKYSQISNTASSIPKVPSSPEARAEGGPVKRGVPYLVGERGPEMFTPNSNGNIIPNNKLPGGTYTIDFRLPDGDSVAIPTTKDAAIDFFTKTERLKRRAS